VTRDTKGFTLIELLIVVVIIGILASIVIPKFGHGKERAMVASMKSDLHNLMTAEEAYFSNGLNYYNGVVPNAGFAYSVSPHVTVTLQNVTNTGWAATASHSGSSKTCAIYVGTGGPVAPAINEGEPSCTP
jgi:prepilin-type N-terminal cleavage/methylation domain-containing protein